MVCDHWARGGAGAEDLAQAVAEVAGARDLQFQLLYPDDLSLWDKTRAIAREIYGADDVVADDGVKAKFRALESAGFGALPIASPRPSTRSRTTRRASARRPGST